MSEERVDKLTGVRASAAGNVVRVVVPVEVAFNLDQIQAVQKDILGRLGCMACCSGWDIRFDIERDFVVDRQLNVRPVSERP
jgi:hypothetical protein